MLRGIAGPREQRGGAVEDQPETHDEQHQRDRGARPERHDQAAEPGRDRAASSAWCAGPCGCRERPRTYNRLTVTPRGTDWGLALLVALGLASGLATWFAGSPGGAWVFGAHALAGTTLALLLVFKLRRVLPRVGARARRDRRTLRGLLALALVLGRAASPASSGRAPAGSASGASRCWSGTARSARSWRSSCSRTRACGPSARAGATSPTAASSSRRPRSAAAAVAAWQVQRPVQRALGLPGARRRFTGSYDAGSFTGNAFPATSWVADQPRAAGRRRLPAQPSPAACGGRSPSPPPSWTAATRSPRRWTAPAGSSRPSTGAACRSAACSTRPASSPALATCA